MPRTISIKSLSEDGWIDRDVLLEHTCFQVLCDFVEEEKPYLSNLSAHIAWSGEQDDKLFNPDDNIKIKDWCELFSLYHWWKRTSADAHMIDRQTLDQNLHRLIELRRYFWD